MKITASSARNRSREKQSIFNIFSTVLQEASKAIGSLGGLLSFGLVLLISIDIFMREIRLPIRGVLEISRLTLAWICFCSLVYTYLRREHVRVTIFTNMLGTKLKAVAEIISCLLGAVLMFAIFSKSMPFFLESWKVREVFNVDTPLPYWLAKLSVPVGSLLFGLLLTADLINYLGRLFRNSKE